MTQNTDIQLALESLTQRIVSEEFVDSDWDGFEVGYCVLHTPCAACGRLLMRVGSNVDKIEGARTLRDYGWQSAEVYVGQGEDAVRIDTFYAS